MTPAQTVVLPKKKPADRQPKASASTAPPPIIDIEAEADGIPVRLVGRDYTAHRPKAMLAIRLGERINTTDLTSNLSALVDSMGEFMRLMFGTEVAAQIMERLDDPDDMLDLPHIQRLVNAMVELVTGRPPTLPSDSAN